MRLSHYFLPLLKEDPREADIVSHRLMLRCGMICMIERGIYSWLPLGLRVLQKIQSIIHKYQQEIGALPMLAPTLQPAELWKESGRLDAYGKEMLRFKDRHQRELIYGPTAEEVLTDIVRRHVKSYKALPLNLYNIQWKMRDEIRPRFGVMRGREFLMKDGYSFDLTPEDARISYEKVFQSYLKTFKAMGVQAIPLRAATGPIGGDLSHEFHILAQTGESELYLDQNLLDQEGLEMKDFEKFYAATDEKHEPSSCPIPLDQLSCSRGIEVGHIFYFGSKYSAAMKALVKNTGGQDVPLEMGSYGIGVSRVLAAIIEAHHDEKGICWPVPVAPFSLGLLSLGRSSEVEKASTTCYQRLIGMGFEVLWDDTEKSPGEKLASMDLLGLPFQLIIGERNLQQGLCELKERKTSNVQVISLEEALNILDATTALPRFKELF